MNKRIYFLVPALMFFLTGCYTLKNDIIVEPDNIFRVFKLKIYARGRDFKQRGKIIWKFDKFDRSRMVFLTPLNQIVFFMYVENKEAILVSDKKRLYWRGKFDILLKRMWGIGFRFKELKDLVFSGIVPEEKKKIHNLKIEIERSRQGSSPYRIKIFREGLVINIKIFSRAIKQGRINPSLDLKKCRETSLEEILENFG